MAIPVIVIGNSSLKSEKLRYLESGIESFINRPIDPEELTAIIKVALQKAQQGNHKPVVREFASGNLRIDYTKRRVTLNSNEVTLTPLEYELLKELTVQAGTPLSYHHLLQTIWGLEYSGEKQYLYVYIGYLRKKIEENPRNPKRIVTLPRIGYVFKTGE